MEAGCLNYDFHVDASDPCVFAFYENWRSPVSEHQGVPKRCLRVPDLRRQQCPRHPELRRAPSIRGRGVNRIRRIHSQHGRGKALLEEAADAMVKIRSAPRAPDQNPRARRHAQDQVPVLVSRALQCGKHRSGNRGGRLTPRILAVPNAIDIGHFRKFLT